MPGYLLVGLTVLGSVLGKHSKAVSLFILLVLIVLMGFNSFNADYVGYKYYYDNSTLSELGAGLNVGYLLTEQVGWVLGLSYAQYRLLFGGLALVLQYLFIRRYTEYASFVLLLYLFVPFFYDVVQFKFFLAVTLALFAFRFLIEEPSYYALKFIVLLLVSATIHPAVLLLGIFLLGKLDVKRAMVVSVLCSLVVLFAVYSGLLQILLSMFVDSQKAAAYFTTLARLGVVPYFVLVVVLVFVVSCALFERGRRVARNQFRLRTRSSIADDRKERQEKFMVFMRSGIYAFLPLVSMVPLSVQDFFRPIRSTLILVYIATAILLLEEKGSLSPRSEIVYKYFFAVWMAFTFYVVFGGILDTVVSTEIENNFLWKATDST